MSIFLACDREHFHSIYIWGPPFLPFLGVDMIAGTEFVDPPLPVAPGMWLFLLRWVVVSLVAIPLDHWIVVVDGWIGGR